MDDRFQPKLPVRSPTRWMIAVINRAQAIKCALPEPDFHSNANPAIQDGMWHARDARDYRRSRCCSSLALFRTSILAQVSNQPSLTEAGKV